MHLEPAITHPPEPSAKPLRITLAQIGSTLGDVEENLDRASVIVRRAAAERADLVVFPELFLTGYAIGEIGEDVSMAADDERLKEVARVGPMLDVVLGFHEDGLGLHSFNAAGYYDDAGLIHCHRKLYLPTHHIFEERKHFSPGQSLRAFDTRYGRVATLICNDAWQPHLVFLAIQDGAQILIVPSNSPRSDQPERFDANRYWRGITAFYARMFQCFVVFVNRVGEEAGSTYWGGSHVVDPWGEIVSEAPEYEEALVTTEIDLSLVRERRREFPLVREARLSLLAREANRLVDEGGDA